jgi:GNAT superfamily N-acetyltransferase
MLELRRCELAPAALSEVAGLVRRVIPRAREIDADFLAWDYARCPVGPAVGINAYADGALVGHIAGTPFRARLAGREERGLNLHHAVTDPTHGGRGIFKAFVAAVLEAGAADGYGFVVGLPNANSTFGVVERLGFQLVRSLDVKLGIGPTPERDERVEPQFARLWSEAELAWRLARPGARYRVQRRGARARVFAPAGFPGAVAELGAYASAWLSRSLPAARSPGPLRIWAGLDPGRRWSRQPYVDLPRRWLPAPLNFVFFDLTRGARRLDPAGLRVDLLDFDAF